MWVFLVFVDYFFDLELSCIIGHEMEFAVAITMIFQQAG